MTGFWWSRIAAVLLVSLLTATGTTASANAKPLAKPLKPLGKQLGAAETTLGKKTAADLAKILRAASTALRKKNACGALKSLGDFVDLTKTVDLQALPAAVPLADTARKVQTSLTARGPGSRCGKIKIDMDGGLNPSIPTIEPLADGQPRHVTSLESNDTQTDFVENELLVSARSQSELQGLLRRTGGELVTSSAPRRQETAQAEVHLVRLPDNNRESLSAGGHKGFIADLRRLDPASRGSLALEGQTALRTVEAAIDEAARGLDVSVNWIDQSHSHLTLSEEERAAFSPSLKFLDGQTSDGFTQGRNFDYFYEDRWSYGAAELGVPEAWQNLEVAGRATPGSVDVAVIDSGFMDTAELEGSTFTTTKAGPEEGKERHGYFVSQVVAAAADNGIGAAGSGAPVARVRGIFYNLDGFSFVQRMHDAIDTGAPIINISLGAPFPAIVSELATISENATELAAALGRLVIASAGNEGNDVDKEDCFFACWEGDWYSPCENNGVLCVGGLGDIGSSGPVYSHSDSNYGFDSCNSYNCSVELFAPYTVSVLGLDGETVTRVEGTSFAAPYVAGVAALMLAADPSLDGGQLRHKLIETARDQNPFDPENVGRWVDAEAAVLDVLPWADPLAGIYPVEGGSYSFGIKRELRAVAVTQEGQPCCSQYSWRSDKDGFLGTGQEINAEFDGGPGIRQVTVTASNGIYESEKTIPVEFTGNRPTAKITKPTEGQTFYRGITYKFQGSWTDIDHGFVDGPCSSLRWSVDRGFGTPTQLSGCQPEINFGVNGQKTITLTATDGDGQTDSKVVRVNVTDPPLNSPPIVRILAPDDGQLLHAGETYAVRGEATDPDNSPVRITYEWKIAGNGVPTKVISTSPQFNWRPADDVPSTCGNRNITLSLTATDPNGPATESQNHVVSFGPC